MKNLLSAVILIALTAVSAAQTQPLTRTQEYRIWSAERMIERLGERFGRSMALCKEARSEPCQQAVLKAYPILNGIREIAADGNDVYWARIIDAVHKLEKDSEEALSIAGRR